MAKRRWLTWLGLGGAAVALLCANLFVCLPAALTDGIWVDECPDGEVVPTLSVWVNGLGRGVEGYVSMHAVGHYTTGDAGDERVATIRRFSASLSLVDSEGQETPLEPEDGWDDDGNAEVAKLRLPQVPDGDYQLRVRADTAAGEASLDVPLGLYAPARVHVLTDRPLYEPGNTVRFRALALRARDLTPLEDRPGTWTVLDPSGQVLLEERAPSGEWGVVAGSFPLDQGAPSGDWTVRWSSGEASGQATIRVEPFTLPRFRVELRSDREAWFIGEQPSLRGRLVYSSGAPVAGAAVEIDWQVQGGWPAPTAWLQPGSPGGLPARALSDENGAFSLLLPPVPADLQGQARLVARLIATDAAGDRVSGSASALLSQDRVSVQAVTELADGLVEGFNNRVYLRATTAAGAPLASTRLLVQRAWDPADAGREVSTDVDGVAALQLDPGPAVNIVVPAPPYRPPALPPAVSRETARDLFGGGSPEMDDLLALDGWDARLRGCALLAGTSTSTLTLYARISANGAVNLITRQPKEALNRCALRALSGARLPAGEERLYELSWSIRPPPHPSVRVLEGDPNLALPSEIVAAIARGALEARSCLDAEQEAEELPRLLELEGTVGSRRVRASWAADPSGGALASTVSACVERAVAAELAGDLLSEPAERGGWLGFVRLQVEAAGGAEGADRPQDTIMLGYELRVTALGEDGRPIGDTRLRMEPGAVPALRMRADPVLPKPGDTVKVELLRGPGFAGELPEKLWLTSPTLPSVEAKLDPKTRTVEFPLPSNAEGWFSVEWGGASARVFVRPASELAVTLTPEQPRYAPGQTARLAIRTSAGERGVPAAVGLFGVDESLGQLATLPGADALDPLRPVAETPEPAFGVLDGAALAMGRVRGENAATAAVLRVSSVPTPPELDLVLNTSASGAFDAAGPLSDAFYAVLAELHALTRAWEEEAPEGEQMSPKRMAELWEDAVDAVEEGGKIAPRDAYGRRLRLRSLPPDLLALTDPRAVVLDSTRLPEDVEDWALWIAREQP